MRLRFHAATFLAVIPVTGCDIFSGRCLDETRSMTLAATLTAATEADTAWAQLHLFEARPGAGEPSDEQSVVYGARSTLDRATVSAIHIHRGAPNAPGRLLYDVPITPDGAESVITVIYVRHPYAGPIEFRTLFALLRDSTSYFDLHVAGDPQPALTGVGYQPSPAGDWFRAFCS